MLTSSQGQPQREARPPLDQTARQNNSPWLQKDLRTTSVSCGNPATLDNCFAHFAQTKRATLCDFVCFLSLEDASNTLAVSYLTQDGPLRHCVLEVELPQMFPQPRPKFLYRVEVGAASQHMPELNANLSIERLCFLAIQETFIVAKQRPWTFLVLWVCGLQEVLALGLQCFHPRSWRTPLRLGGRKYAEPGQLSLFAIGVVASQVRVERLGSFTGRAHCIKLKTLHRQRTGGRTSESLPGNLPDLLYPVPKVFWISGGVT